jgi:tripartite-type tricarboxylate transporter receptor subunit TctC
LHASIVVALQTPEIANRFATTQFAEVVGGSPDELQRFIASEIARWGKVIRDANIRAE